MPNYKGKRPGTRRIILWTHGRRQEWVIDGSKKDGDEFEARKRLELRVQAGPAERRTAARFSDLCEEYSVHAERHLKKSTWRVRTYQLANLIEFFGQLRTTELTLGLVDAYKRSRLDAKCLSTSVNNDLRVFAVVLKWGREMGHDIPDLKVKRLKVFHSPRVKAFTNGELERLWAACRAEAPTLLPILVFLVNTGCRRGEALAAEWDWIDMQAGMIRIPSNEHWQPKNGKPREVPMSDAVRALLSGPRKHRRWVFPSVLGVQFKEFPKDLWVRASRAAGLTGGVHQLRHTYAAHFLAAGKPMYWLAQILGHSDKRVTELYAHLLPGYLEGARNAVNLSPPIETVAARVGRSHRKKPKTA